MPKPDGDLPGLAENWLRRARSNLARAQSAKTGDIVWEDLCFDAQQAAEKALKAVLQHRGIRFPFVHDTSVLLDFLAGAGIDLPPAIQDSVELSVFAVETRYPGDYVPVTATEHARAVAIAERVVAWAAAMLAGPRTA